MTIIFDGTNGITSPAQTSNTSVTTPIVTSTGSLTLKSNNTTAVTVDTSQNVLVGTAVIPSGATKSILLSGSGYIDWGQGDCRIADSSGAMLFYTFTTGRFAESVRFAGNGYVGIGIGSSMTNEAMLQIKATSSQFPQIQLTQDNATDGWNLNATSAGGWLAFQRKGNSGTSTVAYYDPSGNLVISGSTAQKASGTTWSNPSDVRLKNNITDYTKGLTELSQIKVKTWQYNGKGGTTDGSKGLGVIADEIMEVLPETVDTYEAKLNNNDTENTDIKRFDATEITWLLVNSVKELKAIVEQQAEEIALLKQNK